MSRACWMAGLVLIWTSVFVITLGTHFQTQSPRFAEFERREIARQIGSDGKERLNPAGRMALVLTNTWPFSCCFSGFVAAIFTAGILGIQLVSRWQRDLALLVAGVFGLGCLGGAAIGMGEAARMFHWGFITLGMGYILSAMGLGIGAVGLAWSLLSRRRFAYPIR